MTPKQMNAPNSPRPKVKVSLQKKILFSVVTTSLFFVLLEIVLTLAGVAPTTDTEDPFVGFAGLLPLMELSTNEKGEQILSTAENKRHWFNAQSFQKIKAPGTKRVFCMGGSTTYGHPYRDSTSFPGWLREFLPIVDPSQRWEVINAGGISYASYRVAALMEELAEYEPDIFVVYSVHNEFLERRTYQNMFESSSFSLNSQAFLASSRTWALTNSIMHRAVKFTRPATNSNVDVLTGEVDETLNHTVGPVDYHRNTAWREKVIRHYEVNLNRMVAIARRAGAKIVFITPAANEKNCSPFKSEYSPTIQPSDRERLLTLAYPVESNASLEIKTKSIQRLEEAIRIDPLYAENQYRLGQAYMAVDRYSDANRAFSLALNEDVCPLRAVDGVRIAIERTVRELNVPVVDFEKKLRRLSELENGHWILGDEYFLDHVHPTVDVNRRLALWIIDALQANGMVRGKSSMDMEQSGAFAEVVEKVYAEIDQGAQAFALRNLAKVLHWAGKYDEAMPRARDVLKLEPNDLESRYILARCLSNTGRNEESLVEYRSLFSNGVDYPRAYHHFGELLAEMRDWETAKAYLLMAILHDKKNAAAYYSLGLVHLQLKEFQFAEESLEESNRLHADHARTLFYLGQAKAGIGNHREAIALYEKVLATGVRDANIHYQLGLSLLGDKQQEKAIQQFDAALAIAPDWKEVQSQLTKAFETNGK